MLKNFHKKQIYNDFDIDYLHHCSRLILNLVQKDFSYNDTN